MKLDTHCYLVDNFFILTKGSLVSILVGKKKTEESLLLARVKNGG